MHNFCIILIFIIIACFPVRSLAKDPYDKDIVYVVAYKNLNKLKKLLSSKKFDDEDLNAAISIAITLKKFDMAEALYLSMENDDRTLGMNMVNSNIKEPYTTKNVRKYIQKSYDDLNDIGGDCAGIDNHLFEVNAHFLETILSRDKEDCDFEVCGNGLAAIFSGKSEMFQEYKDNKKYAIYNKYCKKR